MMGKEYINIYPPGEIKGDYKFPTTVSYSKFNLEETAEIFNAVTYSSFNDYRTWYILTCAVIFEALNLELWDKCCSIKPH